MALPLPVAIIVAAMSTLASRLLAPKAPKNPLDDSKTEPSHRGSLLGVLAGHYRVGPVIGFVGGRIVSSGIYYERGWHILNCGEGRSLRRIYQGGKAIWQGLITPATYASGSSLTATDGSTFTIYWGEDDQAVNASLAAYVGAESAWPGIMYIWWDTKKLGTSAVWPSLEYEITAAPKAGVKVSSDPFFEYDSGGYADLEFQVNIFWLVWNSGWSYRLDWYTIRVADIVVGAESVSAIPDLVEGMDINIKEGTTILFRAEVINISRADGYTYIEFNAPLPLAIFEIPSSPPTSYPDGWHTASAYTLFSDSFTNQGANPAVSLEQFLFAKRPFGAGLDPTLFDESLQTISDLMVAEEMTCTSLLRSGRSWKDGIASIMQDMGLLLVFSPSSGTYGFRAMRDGAAVTEIPVEWYQNDDMEETFAYSVLASDARIFSYKDSARNFAESTLPVTDDSQAQYGADPNVKTVALETITSYVAASRVVARRDAELSMDGASTVPCSYLYPPEVGEAVTLEGFDTVYRVASVQSNPDEAKRKLELVVDAYLTSGTHTVIQPQGLNPGSRTQVAPDALFTAIEVNRFVLPDTHGYKLLRIRSNLSSSSAYIYNSSEDGSYSLAGTQIAGTGGTLDTELPEDTESILEEGPTFTPLGDDIDLVADLSLQESDWRAGTQMCLIGTELFFLQSISVSLVDSSKYVLNGLIRARWGTNKETHALYAPIYIFYASDLEVFNEPWILPGQDVYVKSLPFNSSSVTTAENVLPVTLEPYSGGGYRPLPCENLNTSDDVTAWVSGEDIDLRWDYKNGASQTGAGLFLLGETYTQPAVEGTFTLTFLTDEATPVVKGSITVSDPEYTYTNDLLVTHFGSEPTSFTVQVVNNFNGLTSVVEETTFEQV